MDSGDSGRSAGAIEAGGATDPTVSAYLLGSAVSAYPGHLGESSAELPAVPSAAPHRTPAAPEPSGFSAGGHGDGADAAGFGSSPAAVYSGAGSVDSGPARAQPAESSRAAPLGPDSSPGDSRNEHPPSRELSRRSSSGGHALLGLCLGLAVLLAAGSFYLGRTTGPEEAGTPGLATVASAPTATVQAVPAPAKSSAPGSGSRVVGTGFVFGKVRENDGETLTISSELTRSEITVHTDRDTELYVLMASRVEGITIGAPVVVYGRRHADGTITAETITGLSLQA